MATKININALPDSIKALPNKVDTNTSQISSLDERVRVLEGIESLGKIILFNSYDSDEQTFEIKGNAPTTEDGYYDVTGSCKNSTGKSYYIGIDVSDIDFESNMDNIDDYYDENDAKVYLAKRVYAEKEVAIFLEGYTLVGDDSGMSLQYIELPIFDMESFSNPAYKIVAIPISSGNCSIYLYDMSSPSELIDECYAKIKVI